MSQRQLSVQNAFVPRSFQHEIKMILMAQKQKALLRSKNESERHLACWSEAMMQPDPDCSVCGGSGYNFIERWVKVVMTTKEARGAVDGASAIHTSAGMIERLSATMWCIPSDAKYISTDDIIIYPYNALTNNDEYVVMNKVPYYVFGDKPFVYRFELFKSTGNQSLDATGRDI